MDYKKFSELLLHWHLHDNKREMPWKGEKDPYKVWLSEIILQQTRVEQGWAYYERFIKKYPAINLLAKAKDEEVFKLWEGLGYYTRCKNLLHTARLISTEYDGKFPASFEEIIALKGIGNYTASAIASFCFHLPYVVVDGNVLRVLSRVFGNRTPVDSNEGKEIYTRLANKVLDKSQPGLFNQAIMDFGATVCKPAIPLCSHCSLNSICIAYRKGIVNVLPVKEKSIKKKTRWLSYFVFTANKKTFVRKRKEKDIWQNLFEFYLVETDNNPSWTNDSVKTFMENQFDVKDFALKKIYAAESQQLTHQHIKGYFIEVCFNEIPHLLCSQDNLWIEAKLMDKLAFPAFINQNIPHKKMRSALFLAV
jgi:A/G-specific adenine glycosylase